MNFQLARELRESGMSYAAIAAVVGASTCAVARAARADQWRKGCPKAAHSAKTEITERDRQIAARNEAVANAYASGVLIEQIAGDHQIEPSKVRSIVRSMGLQLRGRGWTPPARAERDAKIVGLYRDHHVSVRTLSERFGMTPRSIAEILKREKVYDGLQLIPTRAPAGRSSAKEAIARIARRG